MKKSIGCRGKLGSALRFGLLGLLILCVGSLAVFAGINASLPQGSSQPERLSAEQAALMEEALHLKAELGDEVWPGFGTAPVPLLAWNETQAFLCAHPQPPVGWVALEEARVAGMPCYSREWADGQNFIERVGGEWTATLATREWGLIDLRQPFSEMLPGPLRAVAPVFLLVNEGLRPYRYVGMELHEAFHVYQAVAMPGRFADSERAYAAGGNYWDLDPQMHAAWKAEIDSLYRSVTAESDGEARELAGSFLELRRARRQEFLREPDLIDYERRFEWLEGQAKYVELHMLRAADEAQGYIPVPALLEKTTFRDYRGIRQLYNQELSQMKRQAAVEGDSRFYYTGSAQAVLLDRWLPGWKERVGEPGVWIEDLLGEALEQPR